MSNYIEYNDRIAFHPGYYIKEFIDESGLTQEDYAKRLDTTPKNLSILIRGEQSLSIDIAMKMSRLTETDVSYWINLQKAYDALIAEFKSEEELEEERKIFQHLEYKYFVDNFNLPRLPRKIDEQIKELRKFLNVATLSTLTKKNMAISFRSVKGELSQANILKANIMVQIAMNQLLKTESPGYNKNKFMKSIEYALTLTREHENFYELLKEEFKKAGVIFVILPNIPGSKINGATRKVGNRILLMVNDRRLNSDTFWFTLFHEIGHIINGDYGISLEQETGEKEELADKFAADSLIPEQYYKEFKMKKCFDIKSIKEFAKKINRDPGIVLGRLQNDSIIKYSDKSMNTLRHKYSLKN